MISIYNIINYIYHLFGIHLLSVFGTLIAIGLSIYIKRYFIINKNHKSNVKQINIDEKCMEKETFERYFKDETFFNKNYRSDILNENAIDYYDEDVDDDYDGLDMDDDIVFCSGATENENTGLVGRLKSARLKAIEKTLTEDQKKTEKEIEREQLAAIFDLLKKQEEEFNLNRMGEDELKAQLNLYR